MSRTFDNVVMVPGETLPEFTTRLMKHAACDYPTALKEARRQGTAQAITRARTVEELRPILLYLLELNHKG